MCTCISLTHFSLVEKNGKNMWKQLFTQCCGLINFIKQKKNDYTIRSSNYNNIMNRNNK